MQWITYPTPGRPPEENRRAFGMRLRRATAAAGLALAGVTIGGCFGDSNDQGGGPVDFTVQEVAGGLERPWGLAFLPDDPGLALVTERPGRLNLVGLNDGTVQQVDGVPEVAAVGQGGLLDIALHPDYPNSPWVYLTYAAEGDDGGYATHVGRGRLDVENRTLEDFEVLHVATPFTGNNGHFGSRIVFDSDWRLYVTVGDRRDRHAAQDLGSHHGKTLRLTDDGSIPADNPFVDDDDALDAIFSYGHRNAQGMAVHPETGRIWQNEHGQRAGDEINILEKGGNFGWPIATYGLEYDTGEPIGVLPPDDENTVNPVYYWEGQAFPPSGIAFYDADTFPEWRGSLFVGGLGRQYLARFSLNGELPREEDRLLQGRDWRIRDVRVNPHDGTVYLLVDASDAPLVRLAPVSD